MALSQSLDGYYPAHLIFQSDRNIIIVIYLLSL